MNDWILLHNKKENDGGTFDVGAARDGRVIRDQIGESMERKKEEIGKLYETIHFGGALRSISL